MGNKFKYPSFDEWWREYIQTDNDLRGHAYPIVKVAFNAGRKEKNKKLKKIFSLRVFNFFTFDLIKEDKNEKLLNLKRAVFDVLIRDCGRIHNKIINLFGDDSDVKGYLNLLKTAIETYKDENLSNPTGQLCLDTSFVDGIKETK